jgi:DNA polymerase III subunit gamma/tau
VATQSLYRRYRPRRFSEVRGQDHVVRALRDSVAGGREGQAYLFSGPRGTGKTTSARILAKVLNCERPVGGEPCCECPSCLDVERGVSYDVHELDAASNNGVEAMRDLIEKAQLGTPGRHKVYILDEVHMLSKPAEAALLKTLEEPPSHVVFVLATTDPQRVSDTIRSRTQHLRFHLLAPDTLAEHVRWVADDAGLDVDDEAIAAAVSQGAGSARDALSALELIASSGGDLGEHLRFDELVEALIARDPGRALTATAHLVNAGHDPRTIAEEFVRHLRDGFLALMAPDLVQLPSAAVDVLAERSQRLGAPRLVAAIARLGEVLVELRHSPDPRVLVEVALVQLSRADASPADPGDVEALTARIAKLERLVASAAAAPPVAPAPIDPATGRTKLGGRAQRAAATAPPRAEAAPATAPGPIAPVPADAASQPTPPAASGDPAVEWATTVRPSLTGLPRALFAAVELVSADGDRVVLAAPNDAHRARCEAHVAAVQQRWRDACGRTVTIGWAADGAPAEPVAGAPAPAGPDRESDDDDLSAIDEDAPVLSGGLSVVERVAKAFPGAQRIEQDP